MNMNDLTAQIIGAAIKVHRTLGPGLLESAYRICLNHELQQQGFTVEMEKPNPVIYAGLHLQCGFRADLLVQGLVIVECKAKEKLHPVEKAQIASPLRLLGLQVGLLINFHEVLLKDGIQRVVNGYVEQ